MFFKDWLISEMAYVSKEPIYLDKYDISYLKQFPLFFWDKALKLRYNDFLMGAIEAFKKSSSNWSDLKSLNLSGDQRTVNPMAFQGTVNTGITRLIKKLEKLGYDLSGTNAITGTSLYFNPMSSILAQKLKVDLIKTISPKNLHNYKVKSTEYRIKGKQTPKSVINILDPKPNVVYFVPNYLMSHRDDPEPGKPEDSVHEQSWEQFKPKISELINFYVKNLVKISRNKTNAEYWASGAKDLNGQTITQQLYDHVRNNWKRIPHEEKAIKYLINNKINTINQSGVIPRRLDDALKKMGIDFYQAFKKKGWTPLQAKIFIEKNRGDLFDLAKKIRSL